MRQEQAFPEKCHRLPYRETPSILLIRSKENVFSHSEKIDKSAHVKEKYLDLPTFEKI